MSEGQPTPESISDMFDAQGGFEKFQEGAKKALDGMELALGATCRGEGIGSDGLKRFLNRLLGVPLELQDRMFLFFSALMEHFISQDKIVGKYSEGISDVAGKNKHIKSKELLYECPRTGAVTEHVEILTDRGVSWEEAERLLAEQQAYCDEHALVDDRSGFYKADGRNEDFLYFLALRKRQPLGVKRSPYYIYVRPNTGNSRNDYPKAELRYKTKVKPSLAIKRWWDEIFNFYYDKCTHIRNHGRCKFADSCEYGKRTHKINIITGLCLPFWKDISSTLRRTNSRFKVVRIQPDDGSQRLVGIFVPHPQIDDVSHLAPPASAWRDAGPEIGREYGVED